MSKFLEVKIENIPMSIREYSKTEEEMIAEWLKTNQVKKLSHNKGDKSQTGLKMGGRGEL